MELTCEQYLRNLPAKACQVVPHIVLTIHTQSTLSVTSQARQHHIGRIALIWCALVLSP